MVSDHSENVEFYRYPQSDGSAIAEIEPLAEVGGGDVSGGQATGGAGSSRCTPHLRQRLNFCNCRAVRLAISIKFDVFRMVRNHEIALV